MALEGVVELLEDVGRHRWCLLFLGLGKVRQFENTTGIETGTSMIVAELEHLARCLVAQFGNRFRCERPGGMRWRKVAFGKSPREPIANERFEHCSVLGPL